MVSAEEAIGVVIPSWRGRAWLEQLLPQFAEQTRRPQRVVVVDGGSADGSREVTEAHGYEFLDLGANRGFAAAVNAGMRATTERFVAVLNNDLRLAPDWLEKLTGLDAPFAVGLLRRMDTPEVIDGTWDLVSLSGVSLRCGAGLAASGAVWQKRREIPMAPWTAILMRRDYWEAVGELDEDFVSYYEDVDYGLRGVELGFAGVYEPAAVAWHKGSATYGEWDARQVELTARNQLMLLAKHGGRERLEQDLWKVLIGQGLWGMAAAKNGMFGAWLRGKWAGWKEVRSGGVELSPERRARLEALEREIFSLQSEVGMERFWRYYWLLS